MNEFGVFRADVAGNGVLEMRQLFTVTAKGARHALELAKRKGVPIPIVGPMPKNLPIPGGRLPVRYWR